MDEYFLHKLLRNSNMNPPLSKYITADSFPEQLDNNIGEDVVLNYVDERYVPHDFDSENSREPIEFPDREFTDTFTTIRADMYYNYHDAKTVFLSKDFSKMIILEEDKNEVMFVVPETNTHLIGLRLYPEYDPDREAYLFSNQGLENGIATIIEYIGDDKYRIVLDSEAVYRYNPDDILVPMEEPDVAEIRQRLIEGRTPVNG